jgi:putative ABC transport system ATP-binding protein
MIMNADKSIVEQQPPKMIEARSVTKEYRTWQRSVRVLDSMDLQIRQGEFVALVGRSGTGKSTVLNLLGGLDQPTSGQILFEGRHLEAMGDAELSRFRNQTVGFVFQNFFLRSMRTALDNVIVPLMFDSLSLREARRRGEAVLEEVGLGALMHTQVRRLSGGQRQRVAIARAIINQPRILLADEPTGNLDSQTGLEIFELLRSYNQRHQTTIVVVTHDPLVERFSIPMLTIAEGKIVSHSGAV